VQATHRERWGGARQHGGGDWLTCAGDVCGRRVRATYAQGETALRSSNESVARTVEVRARLVKQVHVRPLHEANGKRDSLQLASTQLLHLALPNRLELEIRHDAVESAAGVEPREELEDDAARQVTREQVDELQLRHRLHRLIQQPSEVRLQLGAAKVRERLIPVDAVVGRAVERRSDASSEQAQRRRLADTVRAHQAEHLVYARHRKPMKLEAVGAKAEGAHLGKAVWQIDDPHSIVRAALGAIEARWTRLLVDVNTIFLLAHDLNAPELA
jgi:hypothetical protein